MKGYLEACRVPTARIGNCELPRLVMGIHPYDGCSYQDKQRDTDNLRMFGRVDGVTEVLRYAVEEEGITVAQVDHMIPDLNRLHLQAIWETERLTGVQIGLIAYILVPVALDGEMVAYSERAHSTFYAHNEAAAGQAFREQLERDEILRYTLDGSMANLVTPQKVPPYGPKEAERLEIDYATLEQYLGFFAGCDILVADPGAEIDLLAVLGRFDLIREYIGFLRQRFETVITSVHHAGVTIPLLESEGIRVDGYLTPVNQPGMYMFPTQELALDAIRQAHKPVIAIKPLAGGRYLGPPAFEFVFNDVGVDVCMYGMGTVEQVRETTGAAKQVLAAPA
jgi:hypothetical protein